MSVLAYDLGAGSGRAIAGHLTDSRIVAEEIHRFPNEPVSVGGRLHWDILRLFQEIKAGLLIAKQRGIVPESLGIDSWAVDFGLLAANGELLGNPYHYRDAHTDGVMDKLFAQLPKADIFRRTGIQFLPFNTIYQLYALRLANSPVLNGAAHFLMIPDLLRYFLTGDKLHEFTNATTTQLWNPAAGSWDESLLDAIGVSRPLFGTVEQPGTPAGALRVSIREELGIGAVPVTAVAEHDTGSAVAAIPTAERSFAYLSCGTWSLMGTEVDQPVMSERALEWNFTNEGGVGGTYRLLKNIMGLWILQECKRQWERDGTSYSYSELAAMAEKSPSARIWIDPDDELFLPPGDMPARIRTYCRRSGQPEPRDTGEIVRCILESLALKYRYVLERTEQLAGKSFGGLHMVGGGVRNELLCRWTAGAIGKPVWAGPSEASAVGNLAVQWLARGDFTDIREARAAIRDSFDIRLYEPEDRAEWQEAYERFIQLAGLSGSW